MSSDESPNVPAERDRREAVREKAQLVQAKQSRLRILRGVLIGVGALAVVAGVAGGVVWAFDQSGSQPRLQPTGGNGDGFVVTSVSGVVGVEDATIDRGTPSPQSTPTAAAEGTPTPRPTDSATIDIRVYVDYLSEGARQFQLANASQLTEWVSDGSVNLTYYPVAMLTSKSNGTKYSLRAASAAACVATRAPEAFFTYNHSLLQEQPAIDSDGLNDEDLAALAIASGASSKSVRECIEQEAFAAWAKDATDRALDGLPGTDGVALTGTPMVLVNGTPYVGALDDPKEFSQFVLTIDSDSYYRTASPTPSATPTASPSATPTPTQTP